MFVICECVSMNFFFLYENGTIIFAESFLKKDSQGRSRKEAYYGNWEQTERLGTVWTCNIWVTDVSLGRSKASKPGHNKVVDFLADIAITWAFEESWKGPVEIFVLFLFNVYSVSKDQIYWFIHAFVFLASTLIMHTSSVLRGRWCQLFVYSLFVEDTSCILTFLCEIIPYEMLKWLRLFDWLPSRVPLTVLPGCVWQHFYPQELPGPTQETSIAEILWDGASIEHLPTRRFIVLDNAK